MSNLPPGDGGVLTLTVKVRVSPEPGEFNQLLDLMRRYREALNYSIRVVIESGALSLSGTHRLLYAELKKRFGLPPKVAQDCYREAIAVAKSWLSNPNRGRIPTAKTLRIWLTRGQSYRVKDGYVELLGGLRLRIIGWDRRYDSYPSGDARLVLKDGKLILEVSKHIPRTAKYSPGGVLAVDVNEKHIAVGNSRVELRFETPIKRALRYRLLAEGLQKKYSSSRYLVWRRRRGIRRRVAHFYARARRIVEDWVKKLSRRVVEIARQHQYAVAREDLTGLVKSLGELPREHRVALLMLSYRRLEFWLDWQAEKLGVPVVVVEPGGTSTTCPRCGARLRENGYRRLKCPNCGYEANRDTVAVLNIERKALLKMGGPPTAPTAPQMTDVNPNRCGEPMSSLRGVASPLGRRGGRFRSI